MPSTVIEHFSYDPDSSTLTIIFVSGNVYSYKDVPRKVYRSLKIAGSKGRYFNHFIRNKFEFEHLQI
ncbi:KTSC domain-containing protein [Pedobacter hartonius]|uniref:KTSC domain-containing protein n=1 Tax=Pedobacter hartonius TaxID=425514 RepID=A0A1H4HCN3_9SPHI|nr:KTSC domain-containing protein [Pedobacter hartonius]SEB19426.1 KTSC domain-containing protein [Pedobacter hartonius]